MSWTQVPVPTAKPKNKARQAPNLMKHLKLNQGIQQSKNDPIIWRTHPTKTTRGALGVSLGLSKYLKKTKNKAPIAVALEKGPSKVMKTAMKKKKKAPGVLSSDV